MNVILKAIKRPIVALHYILEMGAKWFPGDALYIKLDYFLAMRKWPNLKNPRTYNEKMEWLKLHHKNPEYTKMVDKYEAKKHVSDLIGEKYIIPTLGVWDKFEDIDFSTLPNQFVLKTTHDSGGIVICKDKGLFDFEKARKKLNKSLRNNFYYMHREYPYKNVKPRIIAEKFMVDESGVELKDYKFFCFNGEVKMLYVATGRPLDTRFDFYDENFIHLPFKQGHPWAEITISKPKGFEEMKILASKLSQGIPHVRVDFYDINGQIFFGELTFFHFSACVPFEPEEWDLKIGEWLDLPNIDSHE